jgi:hypothetical protein
VLFWQGYFVQLLVVVMMYGMSVARDGRKVRFSVRKRFADGRVVSDVLAVGAPVAH